MVIIFSVTVYQNVSVQFKQDKKTITLTNVKTFESHIWKIRIKLLKEVINIFCSDNETQFLSVLFWVVLLVRIIVETPVIMWEKIGHGKGLNYSS